MDWCLPRKHHNNPSSPASTIISLPAHTPTCLKDEREFVGFLVDMPQDVLYGEIKKAKNFTLLFSSSQIPDRPQEVLCRWRDSKKTKDLTFLFCSSQTPDRPQDVLCRWRDSKSCGLFVRREVVDWCLPSKHHNKHSSPSKHHNSHSSPSKHHNNKPHKPSTIIRLQAPSNLPQGHEREFAEFCQKAPRCSL